MEQKQNRKYETFYCCCNCLFLAFFDPVIVSPEIQISSKLTELHNPLHVSGCLCFLPSGEHCSLSEKEKDNLMSV